jgi:hypothetical protein
MKPLTLSKKQKEQIPVIRQKWLDEFYIKQNVDKQQWTQEHTDIQLTEGEQYKYVQQIEYNPYEKAIQNVRD